MYNANANQDSVTITLEPSASKYGMIDKLINQQLGQLHNSLAGTVGIAQQETRMTNKETLRKKR
jgi:hypothetical protein